MTSRVIDYSPLLTNPTPQEVTAYRKQARASGVGWASVPVGQIVLTIVVIVVFVSIALPMFVGMGSMVIGGIRNGSPISAFFVLFFVLTAGLVAYAVFRGILANAGRWGRWLKLDRFARANGFVFSPSDGSPVYPGSIFQLGSDRKSLEHFRTTEGRFLDFGNYEYTTGSGKSRSTHRWGFLALELDRKLPHMVLDSKANNGLFGGTNLPATFSKDQVLSLEGDFDTYFTLYCPKEYERDALYVFTPDLMALLIDEAAPFDVEIVDDWMFVYSAKPFPSGVPAVYERLLRIVDTVGAKTLTQTDRYRDERTAAPFAANVVAPQGARLKRSVGVGAILLMIAAALIWGWSFISDIVETFTGG